MLTLFTVCNGVRVLGYIPQILCTFRDRTGGASTSIITWAIFLTANLSVVPYALVNMNDAPMALVFTANAACCGVIILGTLWKRRRRPATRALPMLSRTVPTIAS